MARDRKRAKQRQQRRTQRGLHGAARPEQHSELDRADLPGALGHASGEVDEFDAALVRGAGGVPLPPGADGAPDGATLEERQALEAEARAAANIEPERAASELFLGGARIERGPPGGGGGKGPDNGVALQPAGDGGDAESAARPAVREPRRSLPSRAIAFLRASWAELQRVQWPDRPQVFQATAVVLGFVALAGVYLGAADWVAQKIVNFIL
ncbi:MAG TPA: preprotein translocase subunit SecE [Solirubrobacteraceae bacterium]|nr:preprotein translocase subunit SecE [Solirubrobacteraceae bacterium]